MTFEEFKNSLPKEYKLYLLYCNEAYQGDAEGLYHSQHTDTQFVFRNINNDLFFSFRGTESFKDVLIDAMVSQQTIAYNNNDSPIRIHKGFYEAYLSIRNMVHDLFRCYYNGESDKIFISGHSLGGALALLCGIDLQYNFDTKWNKDFNVYVISLGQPKVGNKAFVESTNRRLPNYYRIVNADDIVPKLPSWGGYSQCGQLVNIGKAKWYKVASLTDHYLSNYLRQLL